MRLLSLSLQEQYKGLKDQAFDFSESQGQVIALIGLNGSGKSPLIELIGEFHRKIFHIGGYLGNVSFARHSFDSGFFEYSLINLALSFLNNRVHSTCRCWQEKSWPLYSKCGRRYFR
ncbi:ATP-binding cassette domain-containing protein [Photobacterium sp.]|uniref:ATP-binding cassette domain-containing protein n=1 Tax=Photobacterium sp. TaxID=660 RepID=UPI00299D4669|nr:ATP-binding cassette domain-containing protein [Photobacterium sp.]MDX1302045.1 hypothetical protein [Photobacterium sp.]